MKPPIIDPGQKRLEAERYDRRARDTLARGGVVLTDGDGADAVPLILRKPYAVFEEHVLAGAPPGAEVLDLCCGTGRYSLVAAQAGANVTAADLAENNLVIVRRRAERAGLPIRTIVADAEQLPFPVGAFDMVTCVGSLSYVELDSFIAELRRVIRPGGHFICVDSLNHNPVYRLNRRVQYWRGQRGIGTLRRMPTRRTIQTLVREFENPVISYHGVLSFMGPLARQLVGEKRSAEWLDLLDLRYPAFNAWAFKFVFAGRRPGPNRLSLPSVKPT